LAQTFLDRDQLRISGKRIPRGKREAPFQCLD
jgi:hypothetical protein